MKVASLNPDEGDFFTSLLSLASGGHRSYYSKYLQLEVYKRVWLFIKLYES